MRLVEAVVGELRAGIEDRHRIGVRDVVRDCAGDEALALLLHLRADLLAHGAAQQIGLAEAVAGEIARDLHHLLLVGDDAVGVLQDRLELWMDVVGLFLAELAAQ